MKTKNIEKQNIEHKKLDMKKLIKSNTMPSLEKRTEWNRNFLSESKYIKGDYTINVICK